MNHITKLPLVKGLDAILVIVDWYSGMAHFIPSTKKTDRRAGLGRLLARRMKTTRITTRNNHKPRNGIYKQMMGVNNSKKTD